MRDGQYGVRPIPTPTWSFAGKGPVHVAQVFYPFRGGTCPVAEVRRTDVGVETAVEVVFNDGRVDTVVANADRSEVTVGGRVSGERVVVRRG